MRVVLLGSGFGSNAEAILKAQHSSQLGQAQVVGILSDNPDARILSLGDAFNVPAKYIYPGNFKTKLSEDAELDYIKAIKSWNADLVALAGFMRVLKAPFLDAFEGRIINLHPSLLPAFPGLNAIQQAWDYGVKITGYTVHWVNTQVDAGKIIAQETVTVNPQDTLESIEEKVHAAEHKLLPSVIRFLSEKKPILI